MTDLAVCCTGYTSINTTECIALLADGCLEDVQHDTRLTEDERPVTLGHQLWQQPHDEGCLTGCIHTCTHAEW